MACDGSGLEERATPDGPEPVACLGCENCAPKPMDVNEPPR